MATVWIDHNGLEQTPGSVKCGRILLPDSSKLQWTLHGLGDNVSRLAAVPYTGTLTWTGATGI